MNAKKAPTGDFPCGIGDEPEQRRHHNLRLDQLGAIEPGFIRDHGVFVTPPGTKDIYGDPGAVQILRHNRA